MPVWCRMFAQTLVEPTRVWFQVVEPESIDSFKEASRRMEEFGGQMIWKEAKVLHGAPTYLLRIECHKG